MTATTATDNVSILPQPLFQSVSYGVTINYLLTGKNDPEQDWAALGRKSLLGHVVPPFQRGLVWEESRMVSFIESAILGFSLGSWVYNSWPEGMKTVDGVSEVPETHMWLIDGQQRLTALDRYFDDAFPVLGHYWSDLPKVDQRRLRNVSFPANEIRSDDVAFLKVVYDRLNFGGVAHTQDQRASTDDDVEAVMTLGM